jgi:catechol 2,3-dioxygenase
MGHVHLNVADLDAAERFYVGELGFDVTVRSYPGALFVSTGGYHHHIGLNTWAGRGAPAPPPGARGLDSFAVVPPRGERGRRVHDPSGNGVALVDSRPA